MHTFQHFTNDKNYLCLSEGFICNRTAAGCVRLCLIIDGNCAAGESVKRERESDGSGGESRTPRGVGSTQLRTERILRSANPPLRQRPLARLRPDQKGKRLLLLLLLLSSSSSVVVVVVVVLLLLVCVCVCVCERAG